MVMCPCVDGLSHNEAEEITKEWATAGANVLFHAVVETAEIVVTSEAELIGLADTVRRRCRQSPAVQR